MVLCTNLSSVPGLSSGSLDTAAASSRPLEAETRDDPGRSHNRLLRREGGGYMGWCMGARAHRCECASNGIIMSRTVFCTNLSSVPGLSSGPLADAASSRPLGGGYMGRCMGASVRSSFLHRKRISFKNLLGYYITHGNVQDISNMVGEGLPSRNSLRNT